MDDYEVENGIQNLNSTSIVSSNSTRVPNQDNLTCSICYKKFKSITNCRIHVSSIHPDKFLMSAKLDHIPDHQFQIICFDFLSKHNWRKTNMIEFNYPYGCLYCEKIFRKSSYLKLHLIQNHLNVLVTKLKEIQSSELVENEEVTVIQFDEKFQTGDNSEEKPDLIPLKQEDKPCNEDSNKKRSDPKFENVRTYKCTHCEMTYLTVLSLTTHKKESHPEIYEEPKWIYPCDMCDVILSSKSNLRRHKKGRCKATRQEKVLILKTKKIRLQKSHEPTITLKVGTGEFIDELRDPLDQN